MNIKEIIDKERPAPFCGDSLSATDIELMLDRIESAVNKEIADDNLALMQQIKLWSTACKEAEERIAELEAQTPKVVKPQILPVLDRKCECGAALDYGVNYCNNCGAKLVWRDA